jgi:hypothetical protein
MSKYQGQWNDVESPKKEGNYKVEQSPVLTLSYVHSSLYTPWYFRESIIDPDAYLV